MVILLVKLIKKQSLTLNRYLHFIYVNQHGCSFIGVYIGHHLLNIT